MRILHGSAIGCVLVLAMSLNTSATTRGGGDQAGNGGGIVEQNFQYAHLNLGWIVRSCLTAARCVSGSEKILLEKIQRSLAQELKTKPALIFESGATNPTRFTIGGQPRVAVTGNNIGDPIYLNLDLLYLPSSSGRVEPADVGTAIAILIHELAHHQGTYSTPTDEGFLDLLGAKVRAYSATEMERLKTDNWGENPERTPARIEMLAVHSDATALDTFYEGAQTSLLLSDSRNAFPLDSEITNKLRCPIKQGHSGKLLGYRLHGMSWERWRYATSNSYRRLYNFRAPAYIQCSYPTNDPYPTTYTDFDLVITLTFDDSNLSSESTTYEYVEGSLSLKLEPN